MAISDMKLERIQEHLQFDAAPMWKRWYDAFVAPFNGDLWKPNASLADRYSKVIGVNVTPDEAGRVDDLLGAVDEDLAVRLLEDRLLGNALAVLLEKGVQGDVPLSIDEPMTRAEVNTGAGFIHVHVGDWIFRFLYDMGLRRGMEQIKLPGDTKWYDYSGCDPIDEMHKPFRVQLETMMVVPD